MATQSIVLSFLMVLNAAHVFVSARGSTRDTTLATFNAGLISSTIGNVDARVSVLIDQITQSDVDIFCLQEVWDGQNQRKVRRDLKPFYPHALSVIDLDAEPTDTTPVCPGSGLETYFSCRAERCAGQTGLAFGNCGVFSCLQELASLPDPCILCLFFEINTSNQTVCGTSPAMDYEKTFGLMLLSKKELINPTANPFNNQSQIRGYLTASVNGVGDLVCTHLSTPFLPPPLYSGPPVVFPFRYSSYAEQHREEVMTLFDVIMNPAMKVPILLGDFNHGPARTDGNVADFPFDYGLMSARGFVSPYVLKDGRCTFCAKNPFSGGYPNSIIDHIYITTDTTERVLFAKRFLDVVFPSIGTPLSDHYGVKVRLSNIREECNSIQKCRFHCASEIKAFSPFRPDIREACLG